MSKHAFFIQESEYPVFFAYRRLINHNKRISYVKIFAAECRRKFWDLTDFPMSGPPGGGGRWPPGSPVFGRAGPAGAGDPVQRRLFPDQQLQGIRCRTTSGPGLGRGSGPGTPAGDSPGPGPGTRAGIRPRPPGPGPGWGQRVGEVDILIDKSE